MCKCDLDHAHRIITIEPVLFLCGLVNELRWVVFQTLVYQKVCLNIFQTNTSVCDNISDPVYVEEETQVQEVSSKWEFYVSLSYSLPSIILTLLYGSWSDRISRLWPIIFTNIGSILNNVVLIVLGIYPESPIPWVLLGAFINAVCGGFITTLTCGLSYLSSITTEKDRTLRISIAEAMILVSTATAAFISGDLLKATSFAFVFGSGIVINVVVIIYCLVWLKDMDDIIYKNHSDDQQCLPESEKGEQISQVADSESRSDTRSENCDNGSRTEVFQSDYAEREKRPLCDRKYLTDIFKVLIVKRESQRRKYINVQLLIIFFFVIGISPVWVLSYLFLRHYPLTWTPVLYGHWSGFNTGMRGVYLLVALPVMKRCLELSDTMLMVLGTLSGMASLVMFGVTTHTWMAFMVPLTGFFTTGTIISIRGLISTMVNNLELGKIFGIVASLEHLSSVLAHCLFNYVLYPHTVRVWPGLSFIIGAVVMVIPIVQSSWLHVSLKNQLNYSTIESCEVISNEGLSLDEMGDSSAVSDEQKNTRE